MSGRGLDVVCSGDERQQEEKMRVVVTVTVLFFTFGGVASSEPRDRMPREARVILVQPKGPARDAPARDAPARDVRRRDRDLVDAIEVRRRRGPHESEQALSFNDKPTDLLTWR
jgi:hypothetical protein